MDSSLGLLLIAAGSIAALLVAFVLRTRLPGLFGLSLMALTSAAVAAGALLVQHTNLTPLDWGLGLAFLGGFGPIHARIVLGPFGRHESAMPG